MFKENWGEAPLPDTHRDETKCYKLTEASHQVKAFWVSVDKKLFTKNWRQAKRPLYPIHTWLMSLALTADQIQVVQ